MRKVGQIKSDQNRGLLQELITGKTRVNKTKEIRSEKYE